MLVNYDYKIVYKGYEIIKNKYYSNLYFENK